VRRTLSASSPNALLSTTEEELLVWTPIVEAAGGSLKPLPTGRTSGLVGDVIRFCKLRPGR
jgi:hypothetical protein